MRDAEAPSVRSRPEPTRTGSPTRALTFGGDPAFQQALRQRVAAYFATTGQRPRDSWQMYAKTAILLVGFALSYVLLVFAAIALFVGAFIIFNTFSIIVAQRSRELALLRALGASGKQVTRSVAAEAFVVGLLSSILGLALGVLVAMLAPGRPRGEPEAKPAA